MLPRHQWNDSGHQKSTEIIISESLPSLKVGTESSYHLSCLRSTTAGYTAYTVLTEQAPRDGLLDSLTRSGRWDLAQLCHSLSRVCSVPAQGLGAKGT